jgi:hypothetical protein
VTLHRNVYKNYEVKELKKYPFSKKAISAMLAATVALSPVLMTGNVFQPTKVEAATTDYASVQTLISFLNKVYDEVPNKKPFTDAKAVLDQQDWNALAKRIAVDTSVNTQESKELVAGLLELFSSTTVLDLEAKVEAFRTSPKQIANANKVFGENITVEKILKFVADVETTYLTSLTGVNLDNINETSMYLKLVDAIVTVTGNTNDNTVTDNELIGTKFFSLVDEIETLKVLQELTELADADGEVRAALLIALKKVQPVVTLPPVTPTPPPVIKDPVPGNNDHLPKGTTIIIPGPVPGQLITSIPAEKVSELANLITPTNNTILVNLEVAKAGETVKAQIPADLFTVVGDKNENAVVEIKTEDASYKLPASQVNVADLASKLGVTADNVKINISVNVVEATEIKDGVTVVSKVIEFKVEAVSGDKTEPIKTFSTYVERSITGDNNFDSNKSVGVKVEENGTLVPVPTLFDENDATIKSLTNSKYTIVQNNITFSDVNKPWHEKQYIETLANKLIIQGKTDSQGKPNGTFAPGEDMTRAQFTSMLVKALALPSKKSGKSFSDVKESDWFKDALDTAYEYNIISGKPDGSFAPNESVTRSQVAIMLHRAMEINFINDMTKVNTDKKEFTDVAKLDEKTKAAIEAIYEAGIISGKPNGTFDPNGKTLRNQMAKMLAEFLISAKLMNKIK